MGVPYGPLADLRSDHGLEDAAGLSSTSAPFCLGQAARYIRSAAEFLTLVRFNDVQ